MISCVVVSIVELGLVGFRCVLLSSLVSLLVVYLVTSVVVITFSVVILILNMLSKLIELVLGFLVICSTI